MDSSSTSASIKRRERNRARGEGGREEQKEARLQSKLSRQNERLAAETQQQRKARLERN